MVCIGKPQCCFHPGGKGFLACPQSFPLTYVLFLSSVSPRLPDRQHRAAPARGGGRCRDFEM